MSYKVTVIIPTYNAEDYLPNAIDSLRNQTIGFENIEVILVDDNSNDNTKEMLKNLADENANVKSIFLSGNSGTASKPRNIGIQEASSDYIMFLDNDDEYYPQSCEVMYNAIERENANVVSCRYRIESEKSSSVPHSVFDDFSPSRFKEFHGKYDEDEGIIYLNKLEELPNIMTLGHTTMIWTKIYKKSFILEKDIEFPKGDLYEDVYFTSKAYLRANGIVIMTKFFGYSYKLRTEGENKSTCQVFTNSLVEKQLRGFLKIMDFLKEEKERYEILESELIIDMTKIFMYAELTKEEKNNFLNTMKPYYKNYKINTRVQISGLLFNLGLNVFIKIFSMSNLLARVISTVFLKIKKLTQHSTVFLKINKITRI